jgi:hypothetical protein
VVTYDSPELQQKFIDAATMTALGVLNDKYKPGEMAYGIPHPGVFVLNTQQQIVGKIFVESHRIRVDAEGMLAYALDALN